MTTALAVIVVGLLIVWLLKITRDQEEIWRRLNSISVTPGWIRLVADAGETNIRGGSLAIAGPHGMHGPELHICTVQGTVESFPYRYAGGEVSQEERVTGGGFDMAFTTPTLPDMPLPPRIRLEFRGDVLTIRTWGAKVKNAEWQVGDEY